MIAATFNDDRARLQALYDLDLLDTPSELEFNQVVTLAAEICKTPISLVSLVDDHRQWFKAAVGLAVKETPRDLSFCGHAIQQPHLFIVEDATADERFFDNPLVEGEPGIRFYAGMPLRSPDGHSMGTLSVIDTVPRSLSESQRSALMVLANQLEARMEVRAKQKALQAALAEKERVTAQLQASEALFRLFMNHSPLISYIKDAEGRFVFYNAEMARRFSVSPEAWLGRTDHEVWPPAMADQFRQHDLGVLSGDTAVQVMERSIDTCGATATWKSYKFPYKDEEGNLFLAGVSMDVSEELRRENELREANLKLQRLAVTDELTGLNNRRAFEQRLLREFSSAKRRERDLSVLMIDIDDFKRRNDTWGHASGDQVLRQTGEILSSSVRATDIPSRYGGEEFAVLLTETGGASALRAAQRIKATIDAAPWQEEAVTISIGIKTMGPATVDAEQLVREADDALYSAKRAGKNRIHIAGNLKFAESGYASACVSQPGGDAVDGGGDGAVQLGGFWLAGL